MKSRRDGEHSHVGQRMRFAQPFAGLIIMSGVKVSFIWRRTGLMLLNALKLYLTNILVRRWKREYPHQEFHASGLQRKMA